MKAADTEQSPGGIPTTLEEAPRMLVVDDNDMIRSSLQEFFEAEGYDVSLAGDGETALEMMKRAPAFDVVLLDIMLPRKNGFDVLRESQDMGLLSPVLMLTGRGEQENILKGFGLGAADYVIKPFSPEDLSSRVRALVGRWHTGSTSDLETYSFDDAEIDFRKGRLRRKKSTAELSEVEVDILRYLVQHRGQVVTLKRLMRDALTIDTDNMTFSVDHETMMRTIEQHIASLRRKLEPNPEHPKYLETVFGLGYRFNG